MSERIPEEMDRAPCVEVERIFCLSSLLAQATGRRARDIDAIGDQYLIEGLRGSTDASDPDEERFILSCRSAGCAVLNVRAMRGKTPDDPMSVVNPKSLDDCAMDAKRRRNA